MVIQPSSLDTNLDQLLREVNDGTIQLPEFQRDWTWDDNRIRGIIASLSQGYPMGAIMRLQYGNPEIKFKYRTISGVEGVTAAPDYLVLDGQQRLTSIYQALYSSNVVKTKTDKNKEINRYYYLSINDCLDEDADRVDAVFSIPEDRMVKEDFNRKIVLDLSSSEKEYEKEMFPLNIIFDGNKREDWADGYKEHFGYAPEYLSKYKRFRSEIIDTITSYKLPVITLDKSTPREAVCKVFENVNTGGVSLTVFELVTAMFATYNWNLREDWLKCKKIITGEEEPLSTDLFYGIDETAFLTAVTLYTSYQKKRSGETGTISCKKKDVLALDFHDYEENKEKVLSGFRMAREFLLLNQSIFRMRDLPYATQMIPLAAISATLGESKAKSPNAKDILSRWFWCGILGEMYGGANETRYANDIEDVIDEIEGRESQMRTVNAAFFSATRLLTLQTRLSAAYKGIMALLYKEQCADFMDASTIDQVNCMIQPPDIHHIFPEAYCKDILPRQKWNSIVNKTPILLQTNRSIGGKAPSIYIKEILKKVDGLTEEELRKRIESHKINYDALSTDNFDVYFIDRAKALLDLIEKAMGKPVSDRGAEATIERFGASLAKDAQSPTVKVKVKHPPLDVMTVLKEWATTKEAIIYKPDNSDDEYVRFLTESMTSILPNTEGVLSGWKTENHYFYEIHRSGNEVYIQLTLSGKNKTDELEKKFDQINELYPSVDDYPSKGQWVWRHVFKTKPFVVNLNSSKEWLIEQLEESFNEIKSFEIDLISKLTE